ncbi:MAG: hypothetical protein ISS80_01245 [Candidatus Cloacimonetes bacterium]|nr:hypothetical protein [Candidatus Cloacimonadota bacterium]MBL7148675.1 hypothetical protein [Candidatus Cloacimonadota bacterium]
MLKKDKTERQLEKTTIDLDIKVSKEIKKIAKIKGISFSELINQILTNFVKNFKAINKSEVTSEELEEEKYFEYMDSLRKILTDSSIPKKSKKFLIG